MHFTDRAVIIPVMHRFFSSFVTPARRSAVGIGLATLLFCPVSPAQTPVIGGPAGGPLQARSLPGNPYGAIVQVEDESQKSRDLGIRTALAQVLKGAVGRYDERSAPILAQASRLVQQYSFVREEGNPSPMFRAVFDPGAVEAALRAEGLPVFGVNSSVIETWTVQVHGLRTTSDYSRVLRHFTRIKGERTVDVDDLRDDTLQLRMVVEGGIALAAERAEKSGLIGRDDTGNYVLAQR